VNADSGKAVASVVQAPVVSFVLATHNRHDVVLDTLERLRRCGLSPDEYETIVVDNASADGTAEALRRLRVRLVASRRNLGSCAKALGVEQARAPFVVFLDDDSSPRPGAVKRMIDHFESDPRLGAAGFTIHLPDASQECSALPHVFVGCGVGFRATALRAAGGLDPTFFMQAEEYDLAFRLLAEGWKVETFADLAVDHLKSPQARRSERTTLLDVRNNLRVIARYFPRPYASIYRRDWLLRYRWMAAAVGHGSAFRRGAVQGRLRGATERWTHRNWRLSPRTLEAVFRWSYIESRMRRLAAKGVRRIVLADFGKNAYAFVRGALCSGIEICALADDRFAAPRRRYRGIPVVPIAGAIGLSPDAFIVSNTSYVHASNRWLNLVSRTGKPVFNWFEPPQLTRAAASPMLAPPWPTTMLPQPVLR
jgi:GT2 family glycosyltransferase